MIVLLYSIYDNVAKEYGPIYHCKNDGVALRMFKDVIGKVNTDVAFVKDYELYCVGSYDTDTGKISVPDIISKVAQS